MLFHSPLFKTKACANEDLTFFAGYIVKVSQGTKLWSQSSSQVWNFYDNSTVEPQYNEPLYNEDYSIRDDFLYLSNRKIYEKEPRCNKTAL